MWLLAPRRPFFSLSNSEIAAKENRCELYKPHCIYSSNTQQILWSSEQLRQVMCCCKTDTRCVSDSYLRIQNTKRKTISSCAHVPKTNLVFFPCATQELICQWLCNALDTLETKRWWLGQQHNDGQGHKFNKAKPKTRLQGTKGI